MDVLEEAGGHHGGEHRGAAVRDERQGYASHGHDAQRHADVLEGLEQEPAHDADGHQPPEHVLGLNGDPQATPQDQPEQQNEGPGTDEAELLPRDGEHEVGVLLGDEPALGLRPLEKPLALHASGSDRDPGLAELIADALGVHRRVDDHREPVLLVLVQRTRVHDAAHTDDADHQQPQQPGGRHLGHGEYADDDGEHDDRGADV